MCAFHTLSNRGEVGETFVVAPPRGDRADDGRPSAQRAPGAGVELRILLNPRDHRLLDVLKNRLGAHDVSLHAEVLFAEA